MEDLERAFAGLFEQGAPVGAGREGQGAELGQSGLEPGGEGAFALAGGLVGRALFALEKAVFLEGQLVELVTEREMAGEQFGQAHGWAEATAARGGVSRVWRSS